jgi:hypothetical protein
MSLEEAIRILTVHQVWRVGADIPMISPKELTEAIDVIINYYKNTSQVTPQVITDEEIEAQALTFAKEESYGDLNSDLWKGYVFGAKKMREQLKQNTPQVTPQVVDKLGNEDVPKLGYLDELAEEHITKHHLNHSYTTSKFSFKEGYKKAKTK